MHLESLMTNQAVLEQAILKAINGGWSTSFLSKPIVAGLCLEDYKHRIRFGSLGNGETLALEEVIFNHDFAKALWGDKHGENIRLNGDGSWSPLRKDKPSVVRAEANWEYHIKQMVISPDPIDYLRENM